MVNISSGATDIGGGTMVTLPNKDFDSGPTKNYGGTANTIGIFALGSRIAGDNGDGSFSASLANAAGMTSATVYFGNYENFDATPVVWLPGETHQYSGWSGTVTGVMNAAGTLLSITGGEVGTHIFAGSVTAIPEPATLSLLVLGGIATLIRRRNRRALSAAA